MDSAKASPASFKALFTSMAVASQSSLMTPSASFFSVTFTVECSFSMNGGRSCATPQKVWGLW